MKDTEKAVGELVSREELSIDNQYLRMAWEKHERDAKSNKVEQARRNLEVITKLVGSTCVLNNELGDEIVQNITKSINSNITVMNEVTKL